MDTLSRREEDTLRKVTKERALKECDDVVREFANCCTGRTVSIAWTCRDQHDNLKQCLRQYTGEENMERLRADYIKLRRKDLEAGI